MSLVTSTPNAPKKVTPVPVQTLSPLNRNVVVDTAYTPRASLLQYVDGSEWEVTYYSQVLAADSEPAALDTLRSPTDQQYVKISNLELKVTAPLDRQQDEVGRSFDVTGGATVYPHLKPNKYDMFIADVGDGRAGLFTITDVEQKTYFKESHCEIRYQMVCLIESSPERARDLETKTVRRTVFVREFLHYGQNPQLLEGEFADLMKLRQHLADLTAFYFHDFYSDNYNTLLVPGQQAITYDPFLTEAMMSLFTVDEAPRLQGMRRPYVLSNRSNASLSVWDALLRLNKSYMHMAFRLARLLNTVELRSLPEISGIYFTGIQSLVCPGDTRKDVDAPYEPCISPYGPGSLLKTTGRRWEHLNMYLASTTLPPVSPTALQELPEIVPVTIDEYYVFSEAFYSIQGQPLKSKLEVLAKQAISQEPIDKVTLLSLCENCMKWGNLERFYYMPVLFILLRVATRTN